MIRLILLQLIIFSTLVSCSSTKQRLTSPGNSASELIMFTSNRDGNFDVFLMNADSTDVRRLTDNTKTDYGINWSPDGNFILFYSDRTGNEEIWKMSINDTNAINLTNAPSNERAASYSPDGKTIVFISDRDNKTTDLYIMDADGRNVRRLTNNKVYCESPVWVNDGKQIIFTLEDKTDTMDKKFNAEIFIIDIDGRNKKRLTNRKGFNSGADISPDGKRIAFYGKSEKGKYDIFLMDIDGSNQINLTSDDMEDYSPSWSADGKWIACTSGSSSNYDIWKINIQTREKVRLTTHPKRDESPYFRPISQ